LDQIKYRGDRNSSLKRVDERIQIDSDMLGSLGKLANRGHETWIIGISSQSLWAVSD
jgi:hypothetical protein